MSYDTINPRTGQIQRRLRGSYGRETVQQLPTKTLACDRCGWTAQAIDDARTLLPACLCGGTLRVTTAIKEATK